MLSLWRVIVLDELVCLLNLILHLIFMLFWRLLSK